MSELILDVRLDGYEKPVGFLLRDEYGILSFYYHPEYLAARAPINLSLSMPLVGTPFGDAACRAFFGNLLQERDDTIQRLMDKESASSAMTSRPCCFILAKIVPVQFQSLHRVRHLQKCREILRLITRRSVTARSTASSPPCTNASRCQMRSTIRRQLLACKAKLP
jgi:HipA-like protein